MTRKEATAALQGAQERFRRDMKPMPRWARRAFARATRRLALVVATLDVAEGEALRELAELADVPLAPVPVAGSEPRSSFPPDKEGDEELLERRGHLRPAWRAG